MASSLVSNSPATVRSEKDSPMITMMLVGTVTAVPSPEAVTLPSCVSAAICWRVSSE